MSLNRTASTILLALAGLSAGSKQAPPSAIAQPVPAKAVPASTSVPAAAPQRETSLSDPPPAATQAAHVAASSAELPKLEDVEDREGPFTIQGQTFTVVQHLKRQKGDADADATLALLEIVDSAGVVRYRDDFPYAAGEYGGYCPARVNVISGSNGAGFLLDMTCEISAPEGDGPWQILSVANGKISPLGKPFSAEGHMGEFVPGEIKKIGNLTQILPDQLRIDRKSTRLNSSHMSISYAVFCLKKKKYNKKCNCVSGGLNLSFVSLSGFQYSAGRPYDRRG